MQMINEIGLQTVTDSQWRQLVPFLQYKSVQCINGLLRECATEIHTWFWHLRAAEAKQV